jgi:tripartite ATP-independent transporter DctM subunit
MSAAFAIALFIALCAALLAGFPVAFTLGGVALLFAGLGWLAGAFDPVFLEALPNRIFGALGNETLLAVPLFVFMGLMLERSGVAEDLLETMARLFGRVRGGLAVSVMLVGALLAASTGIVGATVVAMGMISLPVMLRHGYDPRLATGTICAAGTLGQIIPPSLVLVLLGDQLGNAYQQAQLKAGNFAPDTVSVGDLFAGALLPGLALVGLYLVYLLWTAWRHPERAPPMPPRALPMPRRQALLALFAPVLLVVLVLGSILGGYATPTEAAAVGAVGSILIALLAGRFDRARLRQVLDGTVATTAMVYFILIGAAMFTLVFRGFGGDDLVHDLLADLPGGLWGALLLVMLAMFLLGFVLDFIEIVFVVVPIVAPALLALGADPVWLGVLMAINLQTSFLTPPFGFSLFYLRGVAPPSVPTGAIYRGVVPFIVLQLAMIAVLMAWPALATWLPSVLYR